MLEVSVVIRISGTGNRTSVIRVIVIFVSEILISTIIYVFFVFLSWKKF